MKMDCYVMRKQFGKPTIPMTVFYARMPTTFTLAVYDDLVVREPDEPRWRRRRIEAVFNRPILFQCQASERKENTIKKFIISLLKGQPFLALGSDEYSIEIFELPNK